MLVTLTKRILFYRHAAVSILLAANTLLITLTLTPASAASHAGMSCCPNGSSTHCSSGMKLTAEPEPDPEPELQPETKPACHKASNDEDVVTIVAEPDNEDPSPDDTDDHSSHLFKASVAAPCAVDCCSFAWSSSKRSSWNSRGLVPRKASSGHLTHAVKTHATTNPLFVSTHFKNAIPRGPPSIQTT